MHLQVPDILRQDSRIRSRSHASRIPWWPPGEPGDMPVIKQAWNNNGKESCAFYCRWIWLCNPDSSVSQHGDNCCLLALCSLSVAGESFAHISKLCWVRVLISYLYYVLALQISRLYRAVFWYAILLVYSSHGRFDFRGHTTYFCSYL